MQRIGSGVGILQGSRVLFSDFADGGAMWTGEGNRECRFQVSFKPGFYMAPSVTVGISMWDIDHKTNSRVDISAEHITPKGFQIVFRTWGDSRIARVRADWMAIGSVKDEDDWDVA